MSSCEFFNDIPTIAFIDEFRSTHDSHGELVIKEFNKNIKNSSKVKIQKIELTNNQKEVTIDSFIHALRSIQEPYPKIINVSSGLIWDRVPHAKRKTLNNILKNLHNKNVWIVASAGNPILKIRSMISDYFPANSQFVFTIGALNEAGEINLKNTSIGENIDFVEKSEKGTSFSAAKFSAKLLNLVLNPPEDCEVKSLKAQELRFILNQNTHDKHLNGYDEITGMGVLNLEKINSSQIQCDSKAKAIGVFRTREFAHYWYSLPLNCISNLRLKKNQVLIKNRLKITLPLSKSSPNLSAICNLN